MTSNRSREIWFAIAKRTVSSFSFIALACCLFASVDYPAIKKTLDGALTLSDKQKILRQLAEDPEIDIELRNELDRLIEAWDSGATWSPDPAIEKIEIRAVVLSGSKTTSSIKAKEQAKSIKKDPLYSDPGIEESSNWFSRAMKRLGDLFVNWFEKMNQQNTQDRQAPNLDSSVMQGIGAILKVVVYAILAGLLGLFGYFVIRHFQWKAKLQRRATAMLEDDEPVRTLDEWLDQADRLTSEGKYREAVRCLYLACLLRFDEASIARFIRSQTNWEHLARIETSPKMIHSIDFREPTQSFDRIWYGFRINGLDDVQRFREFYSKITAELQGIKP